MIYFHGNLNSSKKPIVNTNMETITAISISYTPYDYGECCLLLSKYYDIICWSTKPTKN